MAKAKKKPELKHISYVMIDGKYVNWESLTPEERKEKTEKAMQAVGKVLSDYYSSNIEEYNRIAGQEG